VTKTTGAALTTAQEFLAELGGHRLTFHLRSATVVGVVEEYRRGFIRLRDVTISGLGTEPIQRPIAIVDRSAVVLIY
jgi:hypothetical protein